MSTNRGKPLCLRKRDFWFTVIPLLAWLGAVHARPLWIHPHCATHPASCSPSSLWPIDRLNLKLESPDADGYSYFTQNFSGALAVGGILAWDAISGAGLLSIGTDLVILIQSAAWNGVVNEAMHAITQRPRPFVYSDPMRAKDPENYTSFYSGHTSFAAIAGVALLLILFLRGAPFLLLLGAGAGVEALVFSTAYFRIMAGRHFLTDVLAGAIIGGWIAVAVVLGHRGTIKTS